MATWQQVKAAGEASDKLNAALRALSEQHCAMLERLDVEGLLGLVAQIEGITARVNCQGAQCPGSGCTDQGCPAHYAA